MSVQTVRPRWMAGIVLVSLLTLTSCSSSGPSEPEETPTVSVTINPTSASVEQGGSTDVSVTATGSGGFSGTATIEVDGLPSGVSGTVGNIQSTGGTTTATVTVAVGAAVPAGNYTITVRASASGVTPVTVTFALTVTAAPAYDLTATPSQLIVEQDAQGTVDLTIARTNFTGDVTLAAEGAPSGMATSFDSNPVTGNAAVLTIAPDGTVSAGVYTLTVRGTAAGLADRTTTISVTVTQPAAPDYLLMVTPAILTIKQAESENAAVMLTRSNFTTVVY